MAFRAQSIADRLEDAQAEYIITCDGAYRGGKDIPLKSVIDDALIGNKTVKKVIVYTRTRTPVSMIKGRDVWWEDEMEHAETQVEKDGVVSFPAEEMDAEDPLFILYTSGSTGKPKGVVHTCARLYGLDQLHFCKCISIQARRYSFLYGRYWLDNRAQLYCLWPVKCRCNFS